MSSIPLKNNSGTVSLLSPDIIEIKKLHMTILVFKPLNRICIYPEGRISIYQQNTPYTSEHDFTVDKFNIEAVKEMLVNYMVPQTTAEGKYQNTCPLINEYRENFRMINTELKSMCDMTINVHGEIEGHLNNLQVEIENIKQSRKVNYNTLFLNVFIGLLAVLYGIYMFKKDVVGKARKFVGLPSAVDPKALTLQAATALYQAGLQQKAKARAYGATGQKTGAIKNRTNQ